METSAVASLDETVYGISGIAGIPGKVAAVVTGRGGSDAATCGAGRRVQTSADNAHVYCHRKVGTAAANARSAVNLVLEQLYSPCA